MSYVVSRPVTLGLNGMPTTPSRIDIVCVPEAQLTNAGLWFTFIKLMVMTAVVVFGPPSVPAGPGALSVTATVMVNVFLP